MIYFLQRYKIIRYVGVGDNRAVLRGGVPKENDFKSATGVPFLPISFSFFGFSGRVQWWG